MRARRDDRRRSGPYISENPAGEGKIEIEHLRYRGYGWIQARPIA